MDYCARKCDSPDFSYCCVDGASPFVFIFNRCKYVEPTPEMIAEYHLNAKIVEAHGGRMILDEHQIAGCTPYFTEEDVKARIQSVLDANPDLELDKHWNGKGLTLSVGRRLKKRNDRR
jgi:hypothetical protein